MTWLLRLYPPPWRRRYGDEVTEMLADHRSRAVTDMTIVADGGEIMLP